MDFARKAAQSDEYERRAGRLAMEQGASPAVRSFGEEMIAAHTQTTRSLNDALVAAHLPAQPPPVMTEAQSVMLSQLAGLHGSAFDREYVRQQITAHKMALDLTKAYAERGSTRPVVDAARQTVPIIENHLHMAERLESRGI